MGRVSLCIEIAEGLFSTLFREWIEELTSVLLVCQLSVGMTQMASREAQSPVLDVFVSVGSVILVVAVSHREHHVGKNRHLSNSSTNKNSLVE